MIIVIAEVHIARNSFSNQIIRVFSAHILTSSGVYLMAKPMRSQDAYGRCPSAPAIPFSDDSNLMPRRSTTYDQPVSE